MFVLLNLVQSALTLLVAGIGANDTNHALASNDFAIAANFLNRSGYFHCSFLLSFHNRVSPVVNTTPEDSYFSKPCSLAQAQFKRAGE
jgi:hypothetical protein